MNERGRVAYVVDAKIDLRSFAFTSFAQIVLQINRCKSSINIFAFVVFNLPLLPLPYLVK